MPACGRALMNAERSLAAATALMSHLDEAVRAPVGYVVCSVVAGSCQEYVQSLQGLVVRPRQAGSLGAVAAAAPASTAPARCLPTAAAAPPRSALHVAAMPSAQPQTPALSRRVDAAPAPHQAAGSAHGMRRASVAGVAVRPAAPAPPPCAPMCETPPAAAARPAASTAGAPAGLRLVPDRIVLSTVCHIGPCLPVTVQCSVVHMRQLWRTVVRGRGERFVQRIEELAIHDLFGVLAYGNSMYGRAAEMAWMDGWTGRQAEDREGKV
eukprot:355265-Chlamydomonas_euryale.AAC.15